MEKSMIDLRNEKLAQKLCVALKERHFEPYYCETLCEAKEKILSLIPIEDSVGYGGSLTIDALKIKEALRARGQKIFDRDLETNGEKRIEISRAALLSDTFLLGCNAMSEDGIMVNVDGMGNRLAALVFGPKSVIVALSMKKVVKNLSDAISRAKNYASPVNAQRFSLPTPCEKIGACSNCKSEKSICRSIVVTRLGIPGRIKIVLIGEDAGF